MYNSLRRLYLRSQYQNMQNNRQRIGSLSWTKTWMRSQQLTAKGCLLDSFRFFRILNREWPLDSASFRWQKSKRMQVLLAELVWGEITQKFQMHSCINYLSEWQGTSHLWAMLYVLYLKYEGEENVSEELSAPLVCCADLGPVPWRATSLKLGTSFTIKLSTELIALIPIYYAYT